MKEDTISLGSKLPDLMLDEYLEKVNYDVKF